MDAGATGARAVRRRACCSTRSGPARSCRTTARCSCSPPCSSRWRPAGSSPSASAPPSPARSSPGGASSSCSPATTPAWLDDAAEQLAARARARRARATAPTRCCRGWRSSVPASCSGALSAAPAGDRSPSACGARCSCVASIVSSAASGDRAAVLPAAIRGAAASLYTASALGTALDGVRRHHLARRPPSGVARSSRWLGAAGTMSLTLYVLHALLFELLVDQLGWIRPTGLDTALLFAGRLLVGRHHRRRAVAPTVRQSGRSSGSTAASAAEPSCSLARGLARLTQLLERGAALRVAGVVAAAEPRDALLGRAVGELLGVDAASRPAPGCGRRRPPPRR